jgi:hypothetical protein
MSDDALQDLIHNNNPFAEYTVRNQDIWGKEFLDEPYLNCHASDLVFRYVEQLESRKLNVIGITLRAEKGVGKSHIVSRIRHRLQESGNALFVYMDNYGNLNDMRSEFLKNLATSLQQTGSKDVNQWQELAAALVNDAYEKNYHPGELISIFAKKIQADPKFIEQLTDKICTIKPNLNNPSIIQAILWTLSSSVDASYAVKWLAGNNLPQSKSDRLDLPNSNQEDRSIESFDNICEILSLISQYKSVVICFDQLEGVEISDAGFTKAQVVANFGMDLYNNIHRGVLLTTVYRDIWAEQIKALPCAEAVVDRIGQEIVDLHFLNSDSAVALVKRRLTSFYEKHQVIPPHKLYPFDELTIREKGKQKASARDVLQWCQKNWHSLPAIDPVNLVQNAYEKELSSLKPEEFMDDKNKISQALSFGFESLIGKTLEGVTVNSIDRHVTPKATNKNHLDLRILCTENNRDVKIGVAIVQYPTGNGIQAALSRLVKYQEFGLTRGCLLRSKAISPSAKKALDLVDKLLKELGGEWPPLKIEDLKPLIAIRSVFDAREDYDIAEADIRQFIEDKGLAHHNLLLLDILSDPSGQVPDDLLNEDEDVINLKSFDLVDKIQDSAELDLVASI